MSTTETAARAPAAHRRPPLPVRVYAPDVSPMAPVTLSAIKWMLWADVLCRATSQIRPVTLISGSQIDADTLSFWEFVDRTLPSERHSRLGTGDLLDLRQRSRDQPWTPPDDHLRRYAAAVRAGWLHPVAHRAVAIFDEYAALLNVRWSFSVESAEPGRQVQPSAHSVGRAPVATPAARQPDLGPVVMLHDTRRTRDYVDVERRLRADGLSVHRLALSGFDDDRRHGAAAAALALFDNVIQAARAEHGDAALRLGVRLYFIAVLGKNEYHQFHPTILTRWIRRARQLLEYHGLEYHGPEHDGPEHDGRGRHGRQPDDGDIDEVLRHDAARGYVCPYQLTADLLSRRVFARRRLIAAAYL